MKDNKIGNISRILLALCGIGLIVVLFVPLWTIDLVAPQYPEGLRLIINPDGLAGNVDIINGLNHYIGMKTLHNEDFVEFKILPYIIGTFAGLFLVVAALGKRKLLNILVVLYILFGVVAMADFYKWEYDYGHDLDPAAAIKVPGMAYQPPLIGYKQLLNFSAYSLPATGGWIFIIVGAAALGLAIYEYKLRKKRKTLVTTTKAVSLFFLLSLSSCSTDPEPIKFGTDNCHACKMTISDQRYGAELVTKKGKIYKFDDTHCIVEFIQANGVEKPAIANIYLVDFSTQAQLIDANAAFLFKSDALRSPMAGNVAAFKTSEEREKVSQQYKGQPLTWKDLVK
jgi:copper chaperone NosL